MAGKPSKSGDPRKRATTQTAQPVSPEPLAPTPASAWVSTTGGEAEDLRLPSGNVARVRRVGPEAFLTQGIMPDTITPIVEKAIHSKKGLKPKEQADLAKDPKQLGALMEMLDRTLVYAVLEPRVVMPPECSVCGELDTPAANHGEGDDQHVYEPLPRQDGVLYADRVDLEDKMFVLNFVVGGSRDLERFRREHGAGLAGVSALAGS